MIVAFLLGFLGSLGHCIGMCGAITLLLTRQGEVSGRHVLSLHVGRITTYSLMGLIAGLIGHAVESALPTLRQVQGILALGVAAVAVYLALALLGQVPSPEFHLASLTRRWRHLFQRLGASAASDGKSGETSHPPALVMGLAWGLLPCGLVLSALLPAAVAGTPEYGALTMLAFGLGTWPALVGVSWVARRGFSQTLRWPRQAAALVILLFGVQMSLRGLAAWGWVSHMHVAGVMLW